MNVELPPEDLLARVARQDVAALGEIYDRYAPRVYGLALRILSSRELAEEVVLEVFGRLWGESMSLNQQSGSVAAWLVVTARDLAVDRRRAQRASARLNGRSDSLPASAARKAKAVALPPAGKPGDGTSGARFHGPAAVERDSVAAPLPAACLPQPKEITLIDSRLVLLHKVIDQLPMPQRHALELAVFEGLGEAEIAVEMGEPLGKVQRSLRAAVTFVKHRRRAVCGTWAANI